MSDSNENAPTKKRSILVLLAILAVFCVSFAVIFAVTPQVMEEEAREQEAKDIHRTYDKPAFAQDLPTGNESLEASRAAWTGDEHGWWHAQLKGREKTLYDLLYPHIVEHETDFYLGTLEELFTELGTQLMQKSEEERNATIDALWRDLDRAGYAIYLDHPELFWFTNWSAAHGCTYDNNGLTLNGYDAYAYSADDVANLQPQLDAAVEEALAAIPAEAADYEQASIAYQWIADNITYDETWTEWIRGQREGKDDPSPESLQDHGQTVVSALVEKDSICAGYSRAYQLILSKLGIPCTYVEGFWEADDLPRDASRHGWNLVCLAGSYGWVDVTASDMEGELLDEDVYADDEMPSVWWMYFFMTDSDMAYDGRVASTEEHVPSVTYPACTTVIWDNNNAFEVLEEEDILYTEWGDPYWDSWWRPNFDPYEIMNRNESAA